VQSRWNEEDEGDPTEQLQGYLDNADQKVSVRFALIRTHALRTCLIAPCMQWGLAIQFLHCACSCKNSRPSCGQHSGRRTTSVASSMVWRDSTPRSGRWVVIFETTPRFASSHIHYTLNLAQAEKVSALPGCLLIPPVTTCALRLPHAGLAAARPAAGAEGAARPPGAGPRPSCLQSWR
jgi:hypothetical protein